MQLLLVEDDIRFAAVLITELRRSGHEVNHVATEAGALAAPPCDLVLLDLNLGDGDGMRICRRLRHVSEVPIIMLTARAAERDRVAGLRSGADDYLVKPFGLAELQARIEAVMRRARPGRRRGSRIVGPITIDLDARRVLLDGTPLELTRKEFDLLAALVAAEGAIVPRDQLVTQVWQTTWSGASRTLDVHMATLRAKLNGALDLKTVRGVGFRVADLTPPPP